MAFTVSQIAGSAFGNKLVKVIKVTADAASDSVVTGLGIVEWVDIAAPQSFSTGASGGPKIFLNALSAATAANGNVAISGITSGDTFMLVCYGH